MRRFFRRTTEDPAPGGRRVPLRSAAVLVALALALGAVLPTLAQQALQWVGEGHRMPKAPPAWAIERASPKPGCRYFPETGHNVCGAFLRYWETFGGPTDRDRILRFGYPLTEEYFAPELGQNGVTTQWFERARLELHPQGTIPDRFDVLEGHLAREILAMLTAPGQPPQEGQLDITLDPLSATNQVNTNHTVTAVVTRDGQAQSGEVVRFRVTGSGNPTPSSGRQTTNAQGRASFTFTNSQAGANTIEAWVDLDDDGVRDTNEPRAFATKTWTAPAAVTISLTPANASLQVNTQHTVTATVTQGASALSGQTVRFSVTGAGSPTPNSGSGTTNAQGQVSFSFTNATAGTNTITAYVDQNNNNQLDSGEPQATASVTWTAPPAPQGSLRIFIWYEELKTSPVTIPFGGGLQGHFVPVTGTSFQPGSIFATNAWYLQCNAQPGDAVTIWEYELNNGGISTDMFAFSPAGTPFGPNGSFVTTTSGAPVVGSFTQASSNNGDIQVFECRKGNTTLATVYIAFGQLNLQLQDDGTNSNAQRGDNTADGVLTATATFDGNPVSGVRLVFESLNNGDERYSFVANQPATSTLCVTSNAPIVRTTVTTGTNGQATANVFWRCTQTISGGPSPAPPQDGTFRAYWDFNANGQGNTQEPYDEATQTGAGPIQ